jgi:hypothetical protein
MVIVSNISDVRVEPFHTNESQMITAFSHMQYNVSANSELRVSRSLTQTNHYVQQSAIFNPSKTKLVCFI